MRSIQVLRATPLAFAIALISACSDGTAPARGPITLDSLFVEMNSGFGMAEPVIGMMGGAFYPVGIAPSTDNCAYDAPTQRFVCPSTTTNGFTYSMYYQLLDAGNAAQSAFNPATTAALRTVQNVSGTGTFPDLPGVSMTIASSSDQTLGGLLATYYTLNGSGTTTLTLVEPGQPTETLAMTSSITNLVMPKPGSPEKYPKSGVIAVTISDGSQDIDVSFSMTFDGTSIVKLKSTENGVVTNCTLDLSKPDAAPSC
jgi:hypothetical protein